MVDSKFFMLCKSLTEEEVKDKFNSDRYRANIKFDGERILAIKVKDKVILINRGNNIVNTNFREVVEDLSKVKCDFVIDGEIITRDDNFTKLMTRARVTKKEKLRQREIEVPIKYMMFDILFHKDRDDEHNLMAKIKRHLETQEIQETQETEITPMTNHCDKKLSERLKILKSLLSPYLTDNLFISEYDEVGIMYERCKKEKREGIVVKDMNGIYESGKRSDGWYKVKFFKEEEFTATSYETNPKGIKVIDAQGRSVQVSGEQHYEVKELIDLKGVAVLEIQYLSKSKEGNYRFPSYKRIVENKQ